MSVSSESSRPAIDPTALAPADVVRLFARSGFSSMTEDMLAVDMAAGAPVNPDGTINLMHYTAWLARMTICAGDRDGE